MCTRGDSRDARPWYRHFWVWFLFIPPAATVIFWAVILWTTAASPSLVVDDYAKIGLTYQEQRDRDRAAARLGLSARFHAVRDTGGMTLVLNGPDPPPGRLRLLLAHPAEASRDMEVMLERGAGGVYRADLGRALVAGRYLEITPPGRAWRLTGRLSPGQSELVLVPPDNAGES